ncbi:MAG: DUF3990 domain-containing protein [Bacteroidales bacterium]|nr:DUF3990 domain-containing protein [Bacteroidales bacterium]
MLLYHGSPQIVRKPCILVPNRTLDYGIGFYTTTAEQQAHDWALRSFFSHYLQTSEKWFKFAINRRKVYAIHIFPHLKMYCGDKKRHPGNLPPLEGIAPSETHAASGCTSDW